MNLNEVYVEKLKGIHIQTDNKLAKDKKNFKDQKEISKVVREKQFIMYK